MKYVRTKDGKIYDSLALRVDEIVYKDEQGKWCREYRTVDPLKKALKIAETIEELCDEFVLDHPLFGDNCKCLYHSFEKAKNGIKKRSDDAHNLYDFIIYGAIWTELGLKYVAKMNDKGEFELL